MTAAQLVGIAADRRKTFPEMPLRMDNWKKYVADIE
jgi:dihydroorotate dehydrogenase (NAD+) catalytic subunit